MKPFLLFFCFCFLYSFSYCQVQKFTAEQCQKDIALYKASMEEGNPSLYRYQSRQQWQKALQLLHQKTKSGIDAISFYLLLSRVTAQIGDGHTRMVLLKDYSDFIHFESLSIIPLGLRFLANKVYLQYNYTDQKMEEGAEVISINGTPSGMLLNELYSYVSADNYIKGFLNRRLDLEYRELLALKFGLPKTYRVVLKTAGGKTYSAIVNGSRSDSLAVIAKRKYTNTSPALPWEFSTVSNKSTGILLIRDFLRGPDKNYLRFIDSVFSLLAREKIQNLVIDLRQNTGGYDEHAIALLSYVVSKDFKYYRKRTINKTHYDFLKYTNAEYYNGMVSNFKTVLQADSTYQLTVPWDANYGKKQEKAFSGNTYVLINNRVFSSANAFAANAYNYSNALFIGEESGGAYKGDSGAPVLLTLPNSKFLVQIPLVRYEFAVSRVSKGKGLVPDHVVKQGIDDIVKNRDRQMEFVWKLIDRKTGVN